MNLKNLVKLLGGARPAAAAEETEQPDCNGLKLYTLHNTGAMLAVNSVTGLIDKRSNQCMWISIFHFVQMILPRVTFEDIIQVAGVEHLPDTAFNLESIDVFNIGAPPMWACEFCGKEQNTSRMRPAGTIVCRDRECKRMTIVSFPLQRLANKYNLQIKIYAVLNVYMPDHSKYMVLDATKVDFVDNKHGVPIHNLSTVSTVLTVTPTKNDEMGVPHRTPRHIVSVASSDIANHFELIICGRGVNLHVQPRVNKFNDNQHKFAQGVAFLKRLEQNRREDPRAAESAAAAHGKSPAKPSAAASAAAHDKPHVPASLAAAHDKSPAKPSAAASAAAHDKPHVPASLAAAHDKSPAKPSAAAASKDPGEEEAIRMVELVKRREELIDDITKSLASSSASEKEQLKDTIAMLDLLKTQKFLSEVFKHKG